MQYSFVDQNPALNYLSINQEFAKDLPRIYRSIIEYLLKIYRGSTEDLLDGY